MTDPEVKILKGSPAFFIFVRQQINEPVGIRCSSSKYERCFFAERPFKMQAAGDRSYTSRSAYLFLVAFAVGHVQYRSKTAAVFCRDGAFEQLDVLYDLRVKCGEHTEEMRWVINGSVIVKDQVLVGGSSTNIEAGTCFTNGFYTRQCGDRSQYIRFSKQRGNAFDAGNIKLCHAHLCTADIACFSGGNDHLF